MDGQNYLTSIRAQFQYYKHLAEQALEQVPDESLNWSPTEESNSLTVIINHLSGNMLSRFTDFLTSDGEKPWRDREKEFEIKDCSRQHLLSHWDKGWSVLFHALDALSPDDLSTLVYIRHQGHTVLEALNRQLAHYAYHVGQMVFLSRMIAGDQWRSLSIPRGQSATYNQEKFNQTPHREHFTEEFLKSASSQIAKK